MSDNPHPPRRRGHRLAFAAAVLAGGLAAWAAWSMYAATSFRGRVAAIRAAGDPASIADLAPTPLPADRNAAAPLVEIAPRVKAFARDHGQFLDSPLGKAYEDEPRGERSAEALAAVAAIVDRYADLDAAIGAAAARDDYASPQDYTLTQPQFLAAAINPPIDIRAIARSVRWQVDVAIAEGRPADALRKSIDLLRLARYSREEPGLIGGMLASAVYGAALEAAHAALAAGDVPPELHAALERDLALSDDAGAIDWMLKSERALVIAAIEAQFGGVQGLFMNTAGRFMKLHHSAALDLFDSVLPEASKPWHQTAGKSPSNPLFKRTTGLGMFADMLQPSIEAAYESANRTLALTRVLRVDNARRQFETEHGREAADLSELALPAAAVIDPYSGKPLRLKRDAEGWTIYSIGKNNIDDGGSLDDSTDYGLGPGN